LATIGKGDVVVSAKLDRAFRSAADALAVLEEFKDQAVDLHLIDLGGSVIANGVSKMVFKCQKVIRDLKPRLILCVALELKDWAGSVGANQPHDEEMRA
jgi:hypothetical protein